VVKSRSLSIMSVLLTVICLRSTNGWAEANATKASRTRPATGVGDVVAAAALSCPNILCPTGKVCSFQTLTGTFSSFSRFGALRNKSNVLACVVINDSDTLANGNNGSSDSVCSPASGTAAITGNGKSGKGVTIAFSGSACTNAVTAATTTLLNTSYVITASTTKGITTGQGLFSAAFDTALKTGSFSFNGTTD
jgi:hypothetical protein